VGPGLFNPESSGPAGLILLMLGMVVMSLLLLGGETLVRRLRAKTSRSIPKPPDPGV